MRFLKYFALLSILLLPAAYSHAQVSVGIGVGTYGPPVVYGPPACAYGYYDYYPYACAPYGYYGPDWFFNGVFIGAGPWYHRGYYGYRGYYPRGYAYGYAPRGYYGRGYEGRGYEGRGYSGRGYEGRGYVGGGGFHGGGGGFHGGGGGFHGGGGHGGGHR